MKPFNPFRNKWAAWVLWFLWAVVVLKFSSDTGNTSSGKSGWILTQVLSILQVFGISVNDVELLHTLIRKAAHMFNYLCMGLVGYNALRQTFDWTFSRKLVSAFLLAVAFASFDEYFQTFIPGRTGKFTDVIIDSSGTAIGLFGIWLWGLRRNGFKTKN